MSAVLSQPPAATQTTGAAVTLDHASVRLGGGTVLSDVSLAVGRGEFVAVLGPNGAGKSTLMRAILGLLPLAAGSATVLGRDPEQARSEVGYLPQRSGFDRETRIRGVDLVRLGMEGARWGIPLPFTASARARRRTERDRIAAAIDEVGASDYAGRAIGELSGGEQQRLLVAQALVREPRLLILDEPLDGLDLPNQAAVAALIRRISHVQGVSVLLVTHDVNPLLSYLDQVIYLAAGRALAGTVDEVINPETLSRLYQTPIEVLRTSDGRLVVVGEPEAPHHHGHRHDSA